MYFNEIDPFAAEWCQNLHPGAVVDRRSIADVEETDLLGHERCHLFGGVGTWEYALRLAGWAGPAWTGSCPCQSLSGAGKRLGERDARHLWPEFYRLIRECRPPVVFGEQTASGDGLEWLDGIALDLEGIGYAVAAADLPAACLNAPHRRQRFFWVAIAERRGEQGRTASQPCEILGKDFAGAPAEPGRCSSACGLADANGSILRPESHAGKQPEHEQDAGPAGRLGHTILSGRQGCGPGVRGRPGDRSGGEPLAKASGSDGLAFSSDGGRTERDRDADARTGQPNTSGCRTHGFWDRFDIIPCADGKARRIEPGSQCLVDGPAFLLADGRARADTSRAKILQCIGNAIVPELAATFIRAVKECLP